MMIANAAEIPIEQPLEESVSGRVTPEGRESAALWLPYPPSQNRYWRHDKATGRPHVSREARAYKRQVALLWMTREDRLTTPAPALDGWKWMLIRLHPVRPKDWEKRKAKDPWWWYSVRCIDMDNAEKIAFDALQGIAYRNDKQTKKYSVELGEPTEKGALFVRWGNLQHPPADTIEDS